MHQEDGTASLPERVRMGTEQCAVVVFSTTKLCVCARTHVYVCARMCSCTFVRVRVCVRAWEAREGEGGFGTEPSLHTNMDTCAGRERLIACGTAPTGPWTHLGKMGAATEATMLEVSTSGAVFLLALNDRHPCFERP